MAGNACEPIVELRRTSTPLPQPQGLALGPKGLYVSFRDIPRLYRFDRNTAQAEPLAELTGTAWGIAAWGRRIVAICGTPPDDGRALFEFDEDGRSSAPPVPCPEESGSYVACDGAALYISQFYLRQVLRLRGDATFGPFASVHRDICGITCVGRSIAVLNTADEESTDYWITTIDAGNPEAPAVDVARVPFRARSLAFVGDTYLTNHRERGEIVEFSIRRRG